MKDIFGEDVFTDFLRHDTTNRRSDGIYTSLCQPWENTGFLAHLQDNTAHVCSRVCPKHGDIARWWDVKFSEYVP